MLLLLELDGEVQFSPESVDREHRSTRQSRRGVAAQPVEPCLTDCSNTEDLVAQVEDVVLVGGSAVGHAAILHASHQPLTQGGLLFQKRPSWSAGVDGTGWNSRCACSGSPPSRR